MKMIKKIGKKPQAILGLIIICIALIAAITAPFLAPNNPEKVDMAKKFLEPCREYPLGTDQLGRCELSRLLFGARYSIFLSLPILCIIAFIGLFLGTVSVCTNGTLNRVINYICDVFIAFPAMIVGIAVAGILGKSLRSVLIAIVVAQWAWFTKMVRSYAMMEMSKDYMTAARISGSSTAKIIIKHLIPNIIVHIIIFLSTGIAGAIVMISSLSFLGVGLPPGTAEWGAMLNEARSAIYSHSQLLIYPGICITVVTAGFNLFGEALRDIITPEEESI